MLVNVAHEKLIAVLLRKCISKVEACSPMGRLMGVIATSLYVVVDKFINVLTTLLVVDTTLYDVEKVRNHTASSKALPHVVEVESPRIG